MTPKSVHAIFEYFAAHDAHPATELLYRTPFELLIAVMLSAQSTDLRVNLCTPALFTVAPTPKAMLALGKVHLEKLISSIGLYRTKAKHVLATCALLIERHQGEVPDTREALEALPGVGRKTANVLLNTLHGHPTLAVDTHVFRVANRTGLAHGKTPNAVEQQLVKVIPSKYLRHAHHWLILHGRYTCTARKPKCPTCPIRQQCEYDEKTEEV
ncbi:MAG: endonuclease III [Pseudomonadota bacterium]